MTLATIANPGDARKATPAQNWARALETIGLATRDPDRILTRAIADWASRYGDAPALLSDREAFSFRALEARINQYSRWALNARVAPGETVALVMGNRPEYFAIWLGLIQVGAIVALLSPSLRGAPLVHALTVARAPRDRRRGKCRSLHGGYRGPGGRRGVDPRRRWVGRSQG